MSDLLEQVQFGHSACSFIGILMAWKQPIDTDILNDPTLNAFDRSVLVEILLRCQNTDGEIPPFWHGNKRILLSLQRGQMVFRVSQFAKELQVDPKRVRKSIERLQNRYIEKEIESKPFGLIVSVLNYDKLTKMENEMENERRMKGERKENERSTSNKSDKSDKSEESIYTPEREKEIQALVGQYKKNINKNTVLTEKAKTHIMARYKTFTNTQLHHAIIKFFFNTWRMENNADKGLAWFFGSDEQISKFLSLKNDRKAIYYNSADQDCTYEQLFTIE